jgi:Fe-S cluster biogenesis protein NfuA
MFIQTEETPNPATLKFVPGIKVMPKGTAAFAKIADCGDSPLAKKLFQTDHVRGVFFGSDFITVTKTDDIDWDMLKPEVLAVIMDHVTSGGEIIKKAAKTKDKSAKNKINKNDSEIVKQIKALIEERVRPAVAMDGGDIIFHEFKDGIVYLEMHGACSGCPSSTVTLKSGIENMLKHFVPEVESVEAVNELD